jgi:hypothetical protein
VFYWQQRCIATVEKITKQFFAGTWQVHSLKKDGFFERKRNLSFDQIWKIKNKERKK